MKNLTLEEYLLLSTGFIGFNAAYFYGTLKTDIIQIHKKYTYTHNSNSEFMIIDKNGKHYNVNNSFWYWKWDSIEEWNKLENNDSIEIQYYGYRIPFLGFFPNIVYNKKKSDKIEADNILLCNQRLLDTALSVLK